MALPKIESPTFTLKLPSDNTEVTYRPFTVKEEKVLLTAAEARDINDVKRAIKQVVQGCVVSPENIDVDTMAVFDLEYLFLHLRARSVNNIIELKLKDDEDGKKYDTFFDIDKLEIERHEGHNKVIQLTEDIAIKMLYPTIDVSLEIAMSKENVSLATIGRCIEYVTQGENVYKIDDFDNTEIEGFIESFGRAQMLKIHEFFETLPNVKYTFTYKREDGTEVTKEVTNFYDFFTFL